MDPQELKKIKAQNIVKYVVAGAVCLAVSPIIFGVVQGMVGLILAAGVGFTAIQLTPWFSTKITNLGMRLLMNEARKNPIETMNNIYLDNMKTIQEKDEKIVQFAGRLEDFKSKMLSFQKKYPDEAANYAQIADKMAVVLTRQKDKQRIAKTLARQYHDQIEKAEAIYQMALEAHAVTELAGSIEKQVFQDIRKRVAFDTVTHSFNTAVAQLANEADTDPDSFLLPDATSKSVINAEVVS